MQILPHSPSYSELVAQSRSFFFIKLEKNMLRNWRRTIFWYTATASAAASGSIHSRRESIICATLARINSYARHREWKMKSLFWNVHTIPSLCSQYCFVVLHPILFAYAIHAGRSLYSIASPRYLHWHNHMGPNLRQLFVCCRARPEIASSSQK
jgi:hypothetical protein